MDLAGYSVLEVGEYVAVPYAGKLLSDLGATVTKVEPPGGEVGRRVGPFADGRDADPDSDPDPDPEPEASAFFGYLNTGKRSVTLPREESTGEAIRELIAERGIDLVIEDRLSAHGLDPRALAEAFEDLVVVSASGFGATGPFREYAAPGIVAAAECGQMNKTGYPHRPPTRLRIKAIDQLSGGYAALAGLAALFRREREGGGEYVDVSRREAGVSSMEYFLTGYSWGGGTTRRTGHGYPVQGEEVGSQTVFEAADGYVSASITRWEAFCEEVLDRPDLVDDERFATRQARAENRDALAEYVEAYTRERDKWELFEQFQAIGLPSSVTAAPADVLEFEHLRERDFWRTIELPGGGTVEVPGFPLRVDGQRIGMERPPAIGEHDALLADLGHDPGALTGEGAGTGAGGDSTDGADGADGAPARAGAAGVEGGRRAAWTADAPIEQADGSAPLSGVRVLDFSWFVAGPLATKLLAALGADVVKVESERKPGVLRHIRGFEFDTDESREVSAFWHEFNQGKRDVRVDLTAEAGRGLARELMAAADVVVENFSPGFTDRVGIDHESVAGPNPEVVYLSMPGWGNEGPAREYRSFGFNLQSMAGLDLVSGFPGDPPTTAGQSWPDTVAGVVGAAAVLAALLDRERTGEGAYVELPQYELTVSLLHKALSEELLGDGPERIGNRDEDRRYVQGAYECAGEDRWAAVAVGSDRHWEAFCTVAGRPELIDDERFATRRARLRHHDAVDEAIEAWTRERSPEEVRTRLQHHGVPAGVVANERDLMDRDPQLRARAFFQEHDHPEVGTRRYGGVPFRMTRSAVDLSRPPLFGEHTDEVLAEWLDLPAAEVDRLEEEGALY